LTPTLKPKRKAIAQKYEREIEALYEAKERGTDEV
jgi:long-subunit acyl-CoA synthetase (AMP-forming)